mgnify:CR=1 FL=1
MYEVDINDITLSEVPVLAKDEWKKNKLRPIYLRLELLDDMGCIAKSTECDPKVLYSDKCRIGDIALLDIHMCKLTHDYNGTFMIYVNSFDMTALACLIFQDEVRPDYDKTLFHLFSGRRFGETDIKTLLTISFTEDEKYNRYAEIYNNILAGMIM